MNKNDLDILLNNACFDACFACDIVEVEKLLKSGANVNYADDNPLYNSIADGDVAAVKLLLKYGANLNSLCGDRYLKFKTKTLFEYAKHCSDELGGEWTNVYNCLNSARRKYKIKDLKD